MILAAEAEKESAILRAEASRISKIKEAEGEAEAILQIQEATAKGIEMINSANPSQAVINIKSLEALEKLANGRSTKIIVPSNIQGMAGLATSLVESVKDPE
jgi:regulator of protease activity HflC (stomatin/prohibitin superfamily)